MGKPGINIGIAITFPTMGSTFQAQKEIYKFKRVQILESIERRKCHTSQIVVMVIIAINN